MISGYLQSLLYQSVQRYNILPLTSVCSQACIFCSHYFNPPEVESFKPGHLPEDMVNDLLDYLDSERPVVIGESSTRIEEGEPLLHPRWREILSEVRQRYPETLIKITTSGVLLNQEKISWLEKLKPLRLCISVNLLEPELRRRYLGDSEPEKFPGILEELAESGLELEGSLVMLPGITGFQEIARTLDFLDELDNFKLVRLFKPGYTDYAPKKLQEMLKADSSSLESFIAELNSRLDIPLIYESVDITDLIPEVTGVIKDSPAEAAGIRAGDVLQKIDGDEPFSRVDAFQRFQDLLQQKSPFAVSLKREKREIEIEVTAAQTEDDCLTGSGSDYCGLVMSYDFSPGHFQALKSRIAGAEAERILLVTARGAAGRFGPVLERLRVSTQSELMLAAVRPDYFGGSIDCAGLLVVRDIIGEVKKARQEFEPGLVILPELPFDKRGRDLLGERVTEIEEELSLPIMTI